MRYDTILFDFDGTLNESGPTIFAATRAMMAELNIPDVPDSTIRRIVGPPLWTSFSEVIGIDTALVPKAVEVFREKAKTCGLEYMKPFDGILDLLSDLQAAKRVVGVVTAKMQATAAEQIETYGYKPYVDYVKGGLPSGTSDKADLLAQACADLNVDKARTVMVGDRCYDLEAANAVGVPCIGVLYGYGSREELSAYNPAFIAATVAELRSILLS